MWTLGCWPGRCLLLSKQFAHMPIWILLWLLFQHRRQTNVFRSDIGMSGWLEWLQQHHQGRTLEALRAFGESHVPFRFRYRNPGHPSSRVLPSKSTLRTVFHPGSRSVPDTHTPKPQITEIRHHRKTIPRAEAKSRKPPKFQSSEAPNTDGSQYCRPRPLRRLRHTPALRIPPRELARALQPLPPPWPPCWARDLSPSPTGKAGAMELGLGFGAA